MARDGYRLLFFPAAGGQDVDERGERLVRSFGRERDPDVPTGGDVAIVVGSLRQVMPGAPAGDQLDAPTSDWTLASDEFVAEVRPEGVHLLLKGRGEGAPQLNAAQLVAIASAVGRHGHDATYDPQLGRAVSFPIDAPAVEAAWNEANGVGQAAPLDAEARPSAEETEVAAPQSAVSGVPGAGRLADRDDSPSSAAAALGRPERRGLLSRLLGR